MAASASQRELIVFPTELAMRRFQQEQALKHGWVDASCHTTFAHLRRLCLPYAPLKGKPLSAAQELLMRREVVEVARGHFVGGGPLKALSERALDDVLAQLIREMAALPADAEKMVGWLLNHHQRHKLYQLGILFSVWRATIKQEGFADQLDLNQSILRLLKGNRQKWPPILREVRGLSFRSVRWFNPFEEACVAALNKKLKITVESALPPAQAEDSGERLGQRVRAEIMMKPWAGWAEDLSDALAVGSPDLLQVEEADRIDFSRSAGAYGEIEDLARRICRCLEEGRFEAGRVALIVPGIGAVQDIIPHVFARFQIPYFFRRGRPVLSSPCVKAFLAWLAFPLRAERDGLMDLIRNPAIHFDHREEALELLSQMPPRLKRLPPQLERALPTAGSGREAQLILNERMVEPDDHFNATALKMVEAALEGLGDQRLPLNDLVDLVERLLENENVRPRENHEQGVWILNPHDAVGLDFDLVLFAGLNEGEFPSVPQQDALLNDVERHHLRQHLEGLGIALPQLSLPKASVLLEQESVLFLAAIGMAREELVFSYQSVDQEGNEKGAGDYYRKLWTLAGWCAQDEMVLSSYSQWRIEQLGGENVFSAHYAAQRLAAPEDRVPMPGESFLMIVPLPLCRAKDEALQSAMHGDVPFRLSSNAAAPVLQDPIPHVLDMLCIEAERDAFLETPVAERTASGYCGHMENLKAQIATWLEQKGALSPTALETLAHGRYIFFLEHILGLRDPRVADDMPDPMDRGGLIHSILQEIYTAIAEGESGIDAPRYWAVKSAEGWRRRTEGGVDALPLATFLPELEMEYEAFATQVAERSLRKADLGHPGVWAAEREKVLEQVLNFVRHDAQTCADENRFPALFELMFDGNSAVDLGVVRLKGKIDRVDVVFEETGELKKVRVVDYKGSSRARAKRDDYLDEIARNLDCQLPVYGFAVQQYFFGEYNSENVNGMTEAGYLFYERKRSAVGASLKKSLISLDEPGLMDAFIKTLLEHIDLLKMGDFAVDPLVASYTDFQSICRTVAVEREELD